MPRNHDKIGDYGGPSKPRGLRFIGATNPTEIPSVRQAQGEVLWGTILQTKGNATPARMK